MKKLEKFGLLIKKKSFEKYDGKFFKYEIRVENGTSALSGLGGAKKLVGEMADVENGDVAQLS